MSGPYDAIVVGAGLAGLAAATATAKAGLATLHVAPKAPADRRTSALMGPSVDYLREAGLIGDPATIGHPLTKIRIIDATARLLRAPETLFDAAEFGLAAFGWNFANAKLAEAFSAAGAALPRRETRETSVTALERGAGGWRLALADGSEVSAPLVVGADGKRSLIRTAAGFQTREHVFGQAALVCDLDLSRAIGSTSIEFHYPAGPFTLVPAGDSRANLVWIDDAAILAAARNAGPDGLRQTIIKKSQRLFGDIALTTEAHVFPLSTLSLDRAGRDGIVLVGESAHAFPPIGAQGLNLGLRDVADLAAALTRADRAGPDWANSVSEDYARRRADDLGRTGAMVDSLFRSLLSDMLPAQATRAAGLWALKLLPPLRRQAFRIGMGAR